VSTLVLDTNVVSYLMGGHTLSSRYRPHLEGHTLAISFMTVGELYEGAFRKGWGKPKLAKLRETLRSYVVIPSTPEVCRRWGQIRAERRRRTISVDDAWVAAAARAHGCPLVTHNPRDFSDICDLEVITEHQPAADEQEAADEGGHEA